MTLGDCVVKDVRGRRAAFKGTLAEALQSSSPVTRESLASHGDRQSEYEFQIVSDPTSSRQSRPGARSASATGTGGPSEAQRGPCVPSRLDCRRCRGGKLAQRFLVGTCDLDAINRLTLAAKPSSTHPSYAQVARAAMVAPGIGSVGNEVGGAGGRSFGTGRGGGRAGGGGGTRGGRHGYGTAHGFVYNQEIGDGVHFSGPRFNPNLGAHPNFGPWWDYERGRRGRFGGNGDRGWNGGFHRGRNYQRLAPHRNQQRPPPAAPQQHEGLHHPTNQQQQPQVFQHQVMPQQLLPQLQTVTQNLPQQHAPPQQQGDLQQPVPNPHIPVQQSGSQQQYTSQDPPVVSNTVSSAMQAPQYTLQAPPVMTMLSTALPWTGVKQRQGAIAEHQQMTETGTGAMQGVSTGSQIIQGSSSVGGPTDVRVEIAVVEQGPLQKLGAPVQNVNWGPLMNG